MGRSTGIRVVTSAAACVYTRCASGERITLIAGGAMAEPDLTGPAWRRPESTAPPGRRRPCSPPGRESRRRRPAIPVSPSTWSRWGGGAAAPARRTLDYYRGRPRPRRPTAPWSSTWSRATLVDTPSTWSARQRSPQLACSRTLAPCHRRAETPPRAGTPRAATDLEARAEPAQLNPGAEPGSQAQETQAPRPPVRLGAATAPVPCWRSARISRTCAVDCRRRWSGTLYDRGNGRCLYRRGWQREHMHSVTERTVPGRARSERRTSSAWHAPSSG